LAPVLAALGLEPAVAAGSDVFTEFARAGDLQASTWPVWEERESLEALDRIGIAEAALGKVNVDWPGLWRVVYAPHMYTFLGLVLTRVDVYYDISPVSDQSSASSDAELRSFVRFEGPLWSGWLCAAGYIRKLDLEMDVRGIGPRPTSEVEFNDFWVDLGTELPRRESGTGFLDQVVGGIGKMFFISEFSRFPTLFFDSVRGLTVFQFPLLDVEIAARRVGMSGSSVRPLSGPGAS